MIMKHTLLTLLSASLACASALATDKPNIIFIFTDDMGIGDVSHNGGKAPTPHIDRLAKEGMRFTDAHTTSSVCTPSRYSLLTGRYNWRTRLQRAVFLNPKDKPLIKKDESTVASLLKENGYQTAMVGKWHLGFDWQFLKKYKKKKGQKGFGWDIDYSKPVGTPRLNGFDYFYGTMSSLDMAPYVYVENDMAVKPATKTYSYKGAMLREGAGSEDFDAQKVLQVYAAKSVEYINSAAKKETPFFLYVPLTSPHTPIIPSDKWLGKSGIGKYGDFLMETDWVVGEILQALDQQGIADNTLVLFTTDNGCSPKAEIPDLEKKGHFPNGKLRGTKADLYEGGHRVPTIVRWPKLVPASTQTDRLTSLADLYATLADIVGAKVPDSDGVDSVSFFETLSDPSKTERSAIVMHSVDGHFAIRQGDWKLLFHGGSGGWSEPQRRPEGAPKWQLYNLKDDIGEQKNLFEKHPEISEKLHALMLDYIKQGRSTPGAEQKNAVPVVLEKPDRIRKKK
jgi:arylsulfatase A-like enzyme